MLQPTLLLKLDSFLNTFEGAKGLMERYAIENNTVTLSCHTTKTSGATLLAERIPRPHRKKNVGISLQGSWKEKRKPAFIENFVSYFIVQCNKFDWTKQ